MSRVSSHNSTIEKKVRSLLHRLGYRFRLHDKELPGKPDIVLPRYHTVIFVNGCFWHQHAGCKKSSRPLTRREFWNHKLDDNIARDAKNYSILEKQGWHVLVVWECQTRDEKQLSQTLGDTLEATTF